MTNPVTMKAARIEKYGEPQIVQYTDIARPVPSAGEILVKVFASSINPVDWKIVRGYLDGAVRPPLTLGWDIAGKVEEVGAGVSGFAVGEAVYGTIFLRGGAFAEYAIVKPQEISRKPANLSYEQAAALPAVALTVWQALFDHIKLTRGQRILIQGAAGGVGSQAVQLAHSAGAYVIVTTSAKNADFVYSLGADEVIDYTTNRFEQMVSQVDAVFDTVGGDTLERSYQVVKPGGILVTIVDNPDQAKSTHHNIRALRFGVQPNSAELGQLTEQIEAGKLVPVISQILPLSETRQGLELSQTGRVRGKIVLQIASE